MARPVRGERLQIMLSPKELELIDEFRFKHRMPSRAAAVRELLQIGLTHLKDFTPANGRKSSEFGVFARGPKGHLQGDADTDLK